MATKPTLEAIALLGEFGFEYIAPDQVGEPTPGRIADRLSEIIASLEEALARGNFAAVQQATEKLKRLQRAIDVWSLLASEPEIPEPPAAATHRSVPPVPVAHSTVPQPAPPPAPQASPAAAPVPLVPSAPPPAPPPPPLRPHSPSDIERLEMAAAGTEQGFLRVIRSEPPPKGNAS